VIVRAEASTLLRQAGSAPTQIAMAAISGCLAVDVPKVDSALLDFARVPSLSPLLNSVDIGLHRRL
jgi:hypothetical protein